MGLTTFPFPEWGPLMLTCLVSPPLLKSKGLVKHDFCMISTLLILLKESKKSWVESYLVVFLL